MTKKTVEITAWRDTGCYVAPKNFAEFLTFWKDKLALIPPEFQDTAGVETWLEDDYSGQPYVVWEVTYHRLETDEEYSCRLEREQERESVTRDRELNLLKSLKAKYGEGL